MEKAKIFGSFFREENWWKNETNCDYTFPNAQVFLSNLFSDKPELQLGLNNGVAQSNSQADDLLYPAIKREKIFMGGQTTFFAGLGGVL